LRVKFFNADRGFGFILPDNGGLDVLVHVHEIEIAGLKTLLAGQALALPRAMAATSQHSWRAAFVLPERQILWSKQNPLNPRFD